MKQLNIAYIILFLFLSGCKSAKHIKTDKSETEKAIIKTKDVDAIKLSEPKKVFHEIPSIDSSSVSNATNIVNYAKQYEGVKYKFGGTTKNGMDCSGLIYKCFKAYNIDLPRISRDMAQEGEKISLENVQTGDLLFFKTNKKRNVISHVGLVVTSLPGNIEFIHSTTSQGVIISSLAEHYWYFSFVEARRIL